MFTLGGMNSLRVAELANRARVAPLTVRFYERAGLLSPARRAVNGYRMFDESALEELAFIQRAKAIGMSLEDIAALVAVWPSGSCQSLQAQMRVHLAGQIGAAREQRAGLDAFERQLQTVLSRLSVRDPGPEQCGRGCSCESDFELDPDRAAPSAEPWGCLLDPDALAARIGQWQEVAAAAASVEHADGSVRLALPADLGMIATVAGIVHGRDRLLPPGPVPAGGHRQPSNPHHRGPPWRWAAGNAASRESADPPMNPTAVGLMVLTAVAFPLLLWAIGRAVTAIGERAPYSRSRHYLAGRLDDVRITALIDGGDELLVSLTAPATGAALADSGLLAEVFRVTASECSLGRVRRWRDEGTLLRAYLSHDGALMLAEPMLGGNASCEPATTVTWQAPSRPPHRISHHLMAANRPGSAVVPHQRRT